MSSKIGQREQNSVWRSSNDLREHNTDTDLWIAVNGVVYDVTEFQEKHPGGLAPLKHFAGTDATPGFNNVHPNVDIMSMLTEANVKGKFVNTDKIAEDFVEQARSSYSNDVLYAIACKIMSMVNVVVATGP